MTKSLSLISLCIITLSHLQVNAQNSAQRDIKYPPEIAKGEMNDAYRVIWEQMIKNINENEDYCCEYVDLETVQYSYMKPSNEYERDFNSSDLFDDYIIYFGIIVKDKNDGEVKPRTIKIHLKIEGNKLKGYKFLSMLDRDLFRNVDIEQLKPEIDHLDLFNLLEEQYSIDINKGVERMNVLKDSKGFEIHVWLNDELKLNRKKFNGKPYRTYLIPFIVEKVNGNYILKEKFSLMNRKDLKSFKL